MVPEDKREGSPHVIHSLPNNIYNSRKHYFSFSSIPYGDFPNGAVLVQWYILKIMNMILILHRSLKYILYILECIRILYSHRIAYYNFPTSTIWPLLARHEHPTWYNDYSFALKGHDNRSLYTPILGKKVWASVSSLMNDNESLLNTGFLWETAQLVPKNYCLRIEILKQRYSIR